MISKFCRSFQATLGLACLLTVPLAASDWSQWLGPNRDNIAPDDGQFDPDLSRWQVAWKGGVGHGYSAVTSSGNRAYTLGHDGTARETVFCFDALSGAILWQHAYEAKLLPVQHPGGPNASPTIAGNRVLTLSKDGQLFCLSAESGTQLWEARLPELLGVSVPTWGFANSPVVHNGQVLVSAGKVAALDLATGNTLWTSEQAHPPGYTTPVPFELNGMQFIAALDAGGLSVLSTKGAEISRTPFRAQFNVVAPTPLILDGGQRIFIAGNASSELLRFDGRQLSRIWAGQEMKNALNNSVVLDGAAYGIDGRQGSAAARFVSLNLEDGAVNWARENFGYGTVIGVGATLLALTESGELVTIEPSPQEYHELSRLQVLGGRSWTTPVYSGGRIFVRNERGDVACLVKK